MTAIKSCNTSSVGLPAGSAAESGLAAVEVIDRPVEVEVIKTVHQVEYVDMPIRPRGAQWAATLTEFAGQLRTGRIYDRDLPALTGPLQEAMAAMEIRVRRGGAGGLPQRLPAPGRTG